MSDVKEAATKPVTSAWRPGAIILGALGGFGIGLILLANGCSEMGNAATKVAAGGQSIAYTIEKISQALVLPSLLAFAGAWVASMTFGKKPGEHHD